METPTSSRRKRRVPVPLSPVVQPERDLSNPELLTDSEFDRALWEYVLGSNPLGWEPAKQRILRDRQVRSSLMRRVSVGEDHAAAILPDDDLSDIEELLHRCHEALPDGGLKDEVARVLEYWNYEP